MGTTMQSIAGRGNQTEVTSGAQPAPFQERGQWQRPQRSIESPEATFSTPVQNPASLFAQAAAQNSLFESSGGSQQRNATQAQGGNAPGNPLNARGAHTPTPASGPLPVNGNAGAGNQANMNARGPVEFNHAISYVNKIKVRV